MLLDRDIKKDKRKGGEERKSPSVQPPLINSRQTIPNTPRLFNHFISDSPIYSYLIPPSIGLDQKQCFLLDAFVALAWAPMKTVQQAAL